MQRIFSFHRCQSTLAFCLCIIFFASCSVQKQISKFAQHDILNKKELQTAHIGISLFDPASNTFLYNYQGDKYFVPASNTKLPTCYAAMKYLGDSLISFYIKDTANELMLIPAGDPTFLHPDFPNQQFFHQLQSSKKKLVYHSLNKNEFAEYGSGWSWDDYQEPYLAERSEMPVYGNLIHFKKDGIKITVTPPILNTPFFDEALMQTMSLGEKFTVTRKKDENKFRFQRDNTIFRKQEIPFKTFGLPLVSLQFLADTLRRTFAENLIFNVATNRNGYRPVYSQPVDSFLKPLMHHSDNFFAEQSLLMVSDRLLGFMNDKKIIDTLLKTDFKDLPQAPRWADGSGLSRYNLFTPQDFVSILHKMKNEFGMDRIKVILPTGGEGTISNYYKNDSGYIYAKTGTLSGVVAFSGFLYTKKNKLLIFSTLVNNHRTSATVVRKAVEQFIETIRARY